jgi:hypothetical protein
MPLIVVDLPHWCKTKFAFFLVLAGGPKPHRERADEIRVGVILSRRDIR